MTFKVLLFLMHVSAYFPKWIINLLQQEKLVLTVFLKSEMFPTGGID